MTFNFVEKGLNVIYGGPKFAEKKFINILHTNNFYIEKAVFLSCIVKNKYIIQAELSPESLQQGGFMFVQGGLILKI